jgi:hypothetical protein
MLPASRIERELSAHANQIRKLSKRIVSDAIAIGRHLIDAKRLAGHGCYLKWLDREFGWSERTALNLIWLAEADGKSAKFANLNLPVSAMYLLAAPSTPDKARDEIIRRVEGGGVVSFKEAKKTVAKARTELEATGEIPHLEQPTKSDPNPAVMAGLPDPAILAGRAKRIRGLLDGRKKLEREILAIDTPTSRQLADDLAKRSASPLMSIVILADPEITPDEFFGGLSDEAKAELKPDIVRALNWLNCLLAAFDTARPSIPDDLSIPKCLRCEDLAS